MERSLPVRETRRLSSPKATRLSFVYRVAGTRRFSSSNQLRTTLKWLMRRASRVVFIITEIYDVVGPLVVLQKDSGFG